MTLACGCSSEATSEDSESSAGALTLGSRVTSSLSQGIYDLPGSTVTMRVGAKLDKQVVDFDSRSTSCPALVADVGDDGVVLDATTSRECMAHLTLRSEQDAIRVDGSFAPFAPPYFPQRRVSGTLRRRPPNALVGEYAGTDNEGTLTVKASTDDRIAFAFAPRDGQPMDAEASNVTIDGVVTPIVNKVLGTRPSTLYIVHVSASCDGALSVSRDDDGRFTPMFLGFQSESCPAYLRSVILFTPVGAGSH